MQRSHCRPRKLSAPWFRRSRLYLGIMAGVVSLCVVPTRAVFAQSVTAVNNGRWDTTTTWSDGQLPGPGKNYIIGAGFQVMAPPIQRDGTFDTVFNGDSLFVGNGGELVLQSTSPAYNAYETLTIPGLSFDNGSTLTLVAAAGNINRTMVSDVRVADSGTVNWAVAVTSALAFDDSLILAPTAALRGGADINVSVNAQGVTGLKRRMISIESQDNPFTGNWIVTTTSGSFGTKMGVLEAAGVNALGTGQATLNASILRNAVADGIDSLYAITLNANSILQLDAAWNNPAAALNLDGDNAIVHVAHAGTNVAGNLVGVANTQILGTVPGASIEFNSTADTSFAGAFGGAEGGSIALVKSGPATLTLLGNNEIAGGTRIRSGTLSIGNGGTRGRLTGDVEVDGRLVFARSDAITFGGVISGNGELEHATAGKLYLTADSPFTGTTTISNPLGVLHFGNGITDGSVAGNIVDNGGLVFLRPGDLVYGGVISGTGRVGQGGAGKITLAGQNTYTGITYVSSGSVLQVGNGGTTGQIVGDAVANGTLIFNRSDVFTYGGRISGEGELVQDGTGTLVLTGDSIHTGGTNIAAGTLQIGNGGSTGSILGDVQNAGVLAFDRADTITYDGIVSGSGSLEQRGSGTLVLTADHTYTGGTTIAAGTLQLGNGGASGSVVGNIVDNGVLAFKRSDDLVYADAISGSGSVSKLGTNTLTLSGNSTYTGNTTVSAGTLGVNGSIASNVQVAAGATLQGSGQINANVLVANDGHLAPGDGVGTLTIGGDLLLNSTSQLDYELGNPLSANDRVDVGGNLTLAGDLNITDAGGFSSGVYRLFNYGGTLTDNGLNFGLLPAGILPTSLQVQTSIANQVNLIVVAGGFGLQFWDGSQTVGNGVIDGGTGVWNNANTNWTTADGSVNAAWGQGFAVFQGAAGTVSVVEDVHATGMQFITDGYSVVGGGGRVLAAPNFGLRVDSDATATVAAQIVDGGSPATLTKTGRGTLVLEGANTYSGGTAINAGVLQIGADAALGAAGTGVSMKTATLRTTASFASDRSLQLGGTAILDTAAATTLTWNGTVAGAGNLVKIGAGTLALNGANSFTGMVGLFGGVLEAQADNAFGAGSNGMFFNEGTLRWGGSFDLAASHLVTLGSLGGNFDTNGFGATVASEIDGPGALTKQGAGTLILTGENTYSGGTNIAAGTLQIGNGGSSGSIQGNVRNAGVLAFDRADAITFDGIVSGSGSLQQLGAGTVVLTADHTYTGGTTIAAGTLQLGDGGTSGSVVGNILDNGALVFDRSDDLVYAGTISGTGSVAKLGANTLTWTANQTYAGGTRIGDGTLRLGNGGTSGSLQGDVLNNGTLVFNRSDDVTYAGAVSGTGGLVQAGTGRLLLNGTSSYAGDTSIDAGTLSIAADGAIGDPSSTLHFNGGGLELRSSFDSQRYMVFDADAWIDTMANRNKFGGNIDGAGGLTKLGSGVLVLNGIASYQGLTDVKAGTLAVGDSSHTGAVLLGNGGVLVESGASFGGYGGVAGNVDNRGTLGVGNALPAFATEPDAEFQISGRLINSGLVTLQNNVAGDILWISGDATALNRRAYSAAAGAYVSNGGILSMDVVLNEGGANTQADRLNAESVELAGGATRVDVHAVGGSGMQTVGDGILLVNVANANASAPGAFVLGHRVVAGAYEYLLFQGGQASANGNWYLRSEELNPGPGPGPDPEPDPIVRPEIGSYLDASDAARNMFVHTLHERQAEPDDHSASDRSVWMRVLNTSTRGTAAAGLVRSSGNDILMQAGGDVFTSTATRGTARIGLMAGYGRSTFNNIAQGNPALAQATVKGYAVGAYGSWFADATRATGWYTDAWLQYGWFNNHVSATDFPRVNYNSKLAQGSLELGYTLHLGGQYRLQPQVQGIYSWQDSQHLMDAAETQIRLKGGSHGSGRIGLHAFREVGTAGLTPFADFNVWFDSPASVVFDETLLREDRKKQVYEVDIGLQGAFARNWFMAAKFSHKRDNGNYRRQEASLTVKHVW